MDIGGLAPLGKPGVYELIGTPEELARVQSEQWQRDHEAEIILVNALAAPARLMGERSLVSRYYQSMQAQLDAKKARRFLFGGLSQRQQRAKQLLQGHVEEFRPWLKEERVNLRAFDVKRDLYRPLQIAIEPSYSPAPQPRPVALTIGGR